MSMKAYGRMRPNAFGIMLSTSVYGSAIPSIYGRARVPMKLIWSNNLRKGSSGKKLKSKKKGPPTWVENVDFLIGSNPLLSPLQVWDTQNTKNALNFVKWTGTAVTSGADKATLTVPDTNLYVVLAVTMNVALSGTFDDFGGPGSTPYSGTYELPLWNSWFNGPDTTNPSNVRRGPYSCFWDPSATVFVVSGDDLFISGDAGVIDVSEAYQANPGATFNVYYAQLRNLGVPLARLRLTWENVLGNGPEYSGFASQQIQYPYYAGAGSPDLDLGAAQMIPNIRPEVAGSYCVNAPDGDADFADIVEDIFKSGTLALETQLGEIHRGLNCGELPGMVQQNAIIVGGASSPRLPFYRPNKAGAVLFAFGVSAQNGSGAPTIADGAGNTFVPVATGDQFGIWYVASAIAKTGNVATFSPAGGNKSNATFFVAEMDPDSDVVAAPVVASGSSAEAEVAIDVAGPSWILAVAILPGASQKFASGDPPFGWDWAFGYYGTADARVRVAKRYVAAAGRYTFAFPLLASGAWTAAAIAVSSQDPVSYPKTLGNVLDDDSMQLCRAQCKANGLWGSLNAGEQRNASEYLKDLFQAMNAWPVWSGFKLKSVPLSEVSAVGNGAVYTAPTAAGPVADLVEDDFVAEGQDPVVTIERVAQADVPSILQMQFASRAADYVDVTASEPETSGISLYGPRKESPQVLSCVYDATIARMLLGIAVRRRALIRNTYKFTLKAKWQLLEPGDLVTITEPKLNIAALPVRMTQVNENEQFELECEAEPFVYGMNAPAPLAVTATAPNSVDLEADAGNVNAPIFIEPVPSLDEGVQDELWIAVSNPNANYGGCAVFISTDGGASYQLLGTIQGNAITGVSTADWPLGTDPETVNDLPLDLTESLGALASYQTSDEDNFVYPCYMAGGSGTIPYELMTYAVATLTSANKYTLKATGAGNKLRRGVFGSPIVDHPLATRFCFLGQADTGIFKDQLAPKLIGVTLHFKFCSFNQFGNALQDISTVTDYTYTPTGLPGQIQLVTINGS